ncbi:MAG: tRNA (N6-isopentenyl adenosine(37)-C2)-methylthiotransferase MiaB [Phycisphaerae bacterium]|nr:tRNA (N6-isopentenyl adenosine(37)-C2)-methylthiotransferase MiaB [Phycisphaerae bacterium]
MRIYLETMGCQMNRLDSELLTGVLRAAGHEMVADPRQAEVLLYNTCSVRQHAEDKVHSRLGPDLRRKADSHRPILVGVLGCMAQRLGSLLPARYTGLDLVAGPGQLAHIPAMIAQAAAGKPAFALDGADCAEDFDAIDLARDASFAPQRSQAFVRITRGCNKRCAYCVVPAVRGPEVSRRPEHIVEEVRRLIDAGRSQITLLGQTVNSYRWAEAGRTVRFSDLLAMVSGVPGLRRLRFVTSHPIDFGDDVLAAMRDLPNVCPYIHLPAQSGSDAVLKRMDRRYTRSQYDELVDRCRRIVPGVVLAGDFIVGFPGETDADQAASAELIRHSAYKNCFVFKYSPREGTAAAQMPDDVSPTVKRQRNHELLAVQREVGLAHHAGYVGRELEVLTEGPSRRVDKQARLPQPGRMQLVGRTVGDHIVVFDGPIDLAGQYVRVRITGATSLTLFGQRCDD